MVDDTGATAQVRGESLAAARCASAASTALASTSRACIPRSSWRTRTFPACSPRSRTCLPTHTSTSPFAEPIAPRWAARPTPSLRPTRSRRHRRPHAAKARQCRLRHVYRAPGLGLVALPRVSAKEIFDDGEQLLDACAELGLNIGAVMAVREARLTGEAHAIAAMRRVLDVMREETTAPSPIRSDRSAGLSAARPSSSMPPAATI